MGKIASKEKDEHDIIASGEFAALIPKSMTQDEKLSIGINGDALSATNAGNNSAVSYTHLTLPTIYSV